MTGWDLQRDWADEMKELEAQGWGRAEADRFRLTPAGLRFADSAAELFCGGNGYCASRECVASGWRETQSGRANPAWKAFSQVPPAMADKPRCRFRI